MLRMYTSSHFARTYYLWVIYKFSLWQYIAAVAKVFTKILDWAKNILFLIQSFPINDSNIFLIYDQLQIPLVFHRDNFLFIKICSLSLGKCTKTCQGCQSNFIAFPDNFQLGHS